MALRRTKGDREISEATDESQERDLGRKEDAIGADRAATKPRSQRRSDVGRQERAPGRRKRDAQRSTGRGVYPRRRGDIYVKDRAEGGTVRTGDRLIRCTRARGVRTRTATNGARPPSVRDGQSTRGPSLILGPPDDACGVWWSDVSSHRLLPDADTASGVLTDRVSCKARRAPAEIAQDAGAEMEVMSTGRRQRPQRRGRR